MKKVLAGIGFVLICAVILALSIRGIHGNPSSYTINDNRWKDDGPMELSPERGRFSLLMSIIEDNSLSFSLELARFATPDLGFANGKYVSLFAPGVSYIVIPGYLIGKTLSAGQVGAFAVISFFALLNGFLIFLIAKRLGARAAAAFLGGFTFLFATPAFAYGVSLYQHHISTFLILFSIWILLKTRSVWATAVVWFLCAASIPVDYPNLFLMMPVGLWALTRIFSLSQKKEGVALRIVLPGIFTFLTAALPLAFFLWFNNASYGNPLQFSGTVSSVQKINAAGQPVKAANPEVSVAEKLSDPNQPKRSAVSFFNSRNLLFGFYVHSVSADRGILWYSPVILFGILGALVLYRRHPRELAVLVAVIGVDILLYSMWGDPWGGWAFGSRYLIPAYAICGILISLALTRWQSTTIVTISFFLLFSYSAAVSTAGALTSNRNPPQAEILALEKTTGRVEKYTVERNLQMLDGGRSKSYVFQTIAGHYFTAWQYYLFLLTLIILVGWEYLFALSFSARTDKP